ncbi:MAG TPA: hypothetical protein VGU61_20005 [Noviherbaspirillum sp.]|jgi:uncharacterized protein (UPF0212 family)|uniref:hypothetical protein n=1 Tax=Noviherbaspirillum sp. TaxID=1926288 RepID=UPI002DDCEFAB|nr:hypothetical protein [Noviherbaspirillum sp.]HEV2612557.1 hypothetical protein [Noviherbaspirillum sp.]
MSRYKLEEIDVRKLARSIESYEGTITHVATAVVVDTQSRTMEMLRLSVWPATTEEEAKRLATEEVQKLMLRQ